MSSLFNSPAAQSVVQASRNLRQYPDPFETYSSLLLPRTIGEILQWCEKLWYRNGTYSRACKRIVSYFLTEIKVTECSDDEREDYEEFLREILDVRNVMTRLGEDFMAYGNSFSSLIVPFKRMLRCSKCHTEFPIRRVDYEFRNRHFHWNCPGCKHANATDQPVDRRTHDKHRLRVKRWSPHHMRVRVHPISDRKEFFWNPPAEEIKKIKDGDPFLINEYPWEMIEAILDDKLFQFAEDVVFHMADDSLSGLKAGGWGVPAILSNFHQAYYIQLGKLYNEILMQEYIVPFRVVSPAKAVPNRGSDPGGVGGPSIASMNRQLLKMLKDHRKNPGGYHVAPAPIDYQALGGEGMQFNTYDHITAATDEMLNALGVPVELYKGTLNLQTLPTALRLFEQTWPHLISAFNTWLEWLMQRLSEELRWEKAKAKLQSVTWADDLERRHILMQMMAAGKVSASTVLSPLGIDQDEEIERIIDEQRRTLEAQREFEQEQAQQAQLQQMLSSGPAQAAGMAQGVPPQGPGMGGGMGGGGGPAAAPAAGVTPGDIMGQAEEIAQQLVSMDYASRRRELQKIEKTDQALHAAVKQKMEDIRNQAASQGQQMLLQGGP